MFEKIVRCREDFPSLKEEINGHPLAYFDGPGGTQVPQTVIDAVSHYYYTSNANFHGNFITSRRTDEVLEGTRGKIARFLGADGMKNISYGHNMTTLNFSLSRAFGRYLLPGDEILITQLDHEANRGPWLALREKGIVVREVAILPDGTLDYNDFECKLNEKTRLVAMGYSSNVTGTINNVPLVREMTYKVGALLLVDAVHYAPHFPLDVNALGVDFLLCSAYKFYGPHVGILYSNGEILNRLPMYNLRTQLQHAPYCIETGTLNHAAIAGVNAAIDYIGSFGEGDSNRARIVDAMEKINLYEDALAKDIFKRLNELKNVTVLGPTDPGATKAPTISFDIKGVGPAEVCNYLGEQGICAWNGHFYGIRPTEIFGYLQKGGVTRVGVSVYNTSAEVDRLITAINTLASR
ncbi:MAG: cysteine desulfurase-like protein [Desulfobacteraceae bacterium]|nr:cysteine desulfurase-like protein [Desulfobacteraceae bacterium]